MTSDMDDNKQLVSALADGQLSGEALARGLQVLAEDPEAREAWQAYHLIGDVLRHPELAASTPSPDFMGRLAQRLAQEPLPVVAAAPAVAAVAVNPPAEAANDGVFRWKLVAGLASVVAMGAVAWIVAGTGTANPSSSLARGPGATTVVTGGAQGPMLRDPRLDELLKAHRQLGDATALQAPAGGLHNAVFEPASR